MSKEKDLDIADKVIELIAFTIGGLDKSFVKFMNVAINLTTKIDNENINSTILTFAARDNSPELIFSLLKKQVFNLKSTKETEKIYVSLLNLSLFKTDSIDIFLSIINKTPSYFVNLCLDYNCYNALIYYTSTISKRKVDLDECIFTLIKRADKSKIQYLHICTNILMHNSLYTTLLFDGFDLENKFSDYIIDRLNNEYYLASLTSVLIEFSNYLVDKPIHFNYNEQKLISKLPANILVNYAIAITKSDKRSIFKRLIELKNERYTVLFINKFPKYKIFLPLL